MATLEIKKEIVRLRQQQLLKWVANPFTKHEHEHIEHHADGPRYMPAGRKEPGYDETEGALDGEDLERSTTKERLQEELDEVEEIEEATPIELFYDLFFVANLTTVTSVHYITEWRTLSSYILFFIILWFTWLHVTLLDVRFSVDSVYERICKCLHFAVMAGFSSVSTTWDPFSPDLLTVRALKTMTLTLMFSRFVLGFQYFVVMGFGWSISKKKVVIPLAIHGTVMLISGTVYLGLYYTFSTKSTAKSYIGWYACAFFEIVAILGTSCTWRIVSFKKTHLVERMGLLTLIILGEGIIVMLKGINTIVKGFGWTKTMIGVVISALLVIYLFWMFYFDYNPKNVHYGSIRQQIWALLHFPFHLSIVLAVEGLRQLATMYNFKLNWTNIMDKLQSVYDIPMEEASVLTAHYKFFYADGTSKMVLKEYYNITYSIDELSTAVVGTTSYNETYNELVGKLYVALAEYYGIKAPYAKKGTDIWAEDGQLWLILNLFNLVYQYFFIALGTVFLFYGIFAIIVRRHMDVFDYISIGIRFVVAATFYAMMGLYLNPNATEAYSNYIMSPWPIPQVAIILFLALVADKTLGYFALKRANSRLRLH